MRLPWLTFPASLTTVKKIAKLHPKNRVVFAVLFPFRILASSRQEADMMLSFLVYLACGAVAGILAGLLGVGGGLVIVPMLVVILPAQGIPAEYVQQFALGTSLASIVFTSVASTRAHNARKAVHWDIVRNITPGILAGTFAGGLIATHLPVLFLKIFFVCFLFLVSAQMLSNYRPPAGREMPGFWGTVGAGSGIGLVSSFVGIGGGSLSVPFMSFCNVELHHAVGTSAAIGFPIAVAGALGYVVGGWGRPDLPPGAFGFVHVWALVGIATASFLTAPLGAKLSHSLPTAKLKRGFAIFLIMVALRMLYGIL
jgi:uncharacterized membrane protein YfcA